MVFPVVTQIGKDHMGTINGKLYAQTATETPRGSLVEMQSRPFETLRRVSPITKEAIAQPCSQIS